ncbi:hypothetical protein AMJ57_02965 [Parcubacteria bacterium SG8_24]|nr:MAG: hypothetical protein AMJ57_02965 [Parcubacteria bacterium SG8_24]
MFEFLSLVLAQALYTTADTWKKFIFAAKGFSVPAFVNWAFFATLVISLVGFFFQMYALSRIELSRTIISMGVMAVIFSAAAGALFLKEQLHWWNLLGVAFAVSAIILVNLR